MKARHEFETEKDYLEYLRYYYAGVALPYYLERYAKHTEHAINAAYNAVVASDELIKQLLNNPHDLH